MELKSVLTMHIDTNSRRAIKYFSDSPIPNIVYIINNKLDHTVLRCDIEFNNNCLHNNHYVHYYIGILTASFNIYFCA